VTSLTTRPLYLWRKYLRCPLNRTLCRSQRLCGPFGVEKNILFLTAIKLRFSVVQSAEHIEKIKQTVDERHALHGARTPQRRLKSRNSFLGKVQVEPPEDFPPTQICPGSHLLDFNTWKSLNRTRTGVAPVKTNMVKWGKTKSDDLYCGCGEV
jgi:hypothetical protein